MNADTFDLFEHNSSMSDDILLSFKGPFDKKVLAVIGNTIQQFTKGHSDVGKRLFKIFIELAQNISFYSGERSAFDASIGVGSLLIREDEEHYYLHTGNLIKKLDAEPLLEKCEIINSLDRKGLRDFKREQRNLPRGERGTANVGLIQIALTSENPLRFRITSVNDDFSFFAIRVKVLKAS